MKSGLTKTMRDARKEFCLKYKDWILEDWKRVIWTDETSVILGHRRGSIRVGRITKEKNVNNVTRRR